MPFNFLLFYLLKQLVAFDILEILIGADLQLIGSLFVADDDAMLVHLESRDGPHVVDATLDSCLEGTCLGMAIDEDHHLTGVHDCAYTNGEGMSRNVLGLATKEATVGDTGIGGEGLHTGSGAQ